MLNMYDNYIINILNYRFNNVIEVYSDSVIEVK